MTAWFMACMLALVAIGAPLFVLVGVATALSLLWFVNGFQPHDLTLLIQHMENLATKQEFLAIPLFMASGAVMTAGGIAQRLVRLMAALLGWLPGGMAIAAVVACMFFAAISGSSPVTLIAVGSMMFPALVKDGYPENFSLGLITTAGSLGCLVPPSLAMLIYAISVSGAVQVDPSDLFLCGLMPALLVAFLLAMYSFYVGRKTGHAQVKWDPVEVKTAFKEGVWALMLPVVVLGGIYGGWYTPSQAGGVAAAYSVFVTCWVYRSFNLRKILDALMESAGLMGTLLPIIVLAFGLNEFLALMDVQEKLQQTIVRLHPSPAMFMLWVNVALIVLGALMDSISATLIFAPMLAPVAYHVYGIDPLHFGVVFVVNMEIGYLAPPVATNLFVASAVFKKPFAQVAKAVWPTLGITVAALLAVMYIPSISLGLVRMKQGKPAYVSFPWEQPKKNDVSTSATPSLKSLTGKVLDGLED